MIRTADSTRRRTLALVAALAFAGALLVSVPAAAFAQAAYPVQSRGNRGSDVVALQYLLRANGQNVAVDGVFGAGTENAVKAFQDDENIGVDGIVGSQTWGRLVVTVQLGSTGNAVRAVQRLLNEKRSAVLDVDGVFGVLTRQAVRDFQAHAAIGVDGVVGPTTWRNLLWHFEKINVGLDAVCGYGADAARWGTGAAIGQLEAAARSFFARGDGPMSVGDIGLEHGGDIAGHASHEDGLDVDLRPIRGDNNQCNAGCQWNQACYDRAATRAFVNAIRDKASGHVKLIFFNDPVLIDEGLSQALAGHDNHLHVRYCEKVHADARYDC